MREKEKNMRKITAIVLSIGMVLSMAACGQKNPETATQAATTTAAAKQETTVAETKAEETKAETAAAETPGGDFESELQNILNSATEDSLKRVLDAGVLTCGCEGNWIPYLYYDKEDSENLTGFHAEVAKKIAEKLGVDIKFDVASQFDGILAGLQAKRYDCISEGLKNSTVEPFEGLTNSMLYNQDMPVIIVAADNTDIVDIPSMNGKKAGNSTTSSYGKIAFNAGCDCNPDLDFAMAINGIINGTIDLTVNSMVVYNTYLESYPEAADKIKIAFIYEPEKVEDLQGGITLRSEDASLIAAVDLAIKDLLEDGTIIELSRQFMGDEFTDSAVLYKEYLQ